MCFMLFACGWTIHASHAKKHIKKLTTTPTPQLNFVESCQNRSQTFFFLLNIARGDGGFLSFLHARREFFAGNFMFLGHSFFMKKTCLKKFCVIFLSKFMILKNMIFYENVQTRFFARPKIITEKKNMFFASKCVTLLMPSLGNGRKNKVTPRRIVKTNARVSLLKFNQTCVQKSVFGKSMCTFLQCRTLCFRHKKCSFCQSKTDKQQASIVVFEFLAAK